MKTCLKCDKVLSKSKYTHCKKHAGGRFAGRTHSEESRRKISDSVVALDRKNDLVWFLAVQESALRRRTCLRSCIDCGDVVDRHATWCKSCAHKGERNPSYVHGEHWVRMALRTTREYRAWNRAVRERDNNTCQECGTTEGRLEVDHIKPFALYPDLRLDINNGRVLCHTCHRATPTFGWKLKYITK